MAVIRKVIRLVDSPASKEEMALFDRAATCSFITPEFARQLDVVTALSATKVFGAARSGGQLVSTERVSLDFLFEGYRFSDEFMLVPELSERVIIGAATLQKWRTKLDFEHDEVIIDPPVTKLRLM